MLGFFGDCVLKPRTLDRRTRRLLFALARLPTLAAGALLLLYALLLPGLFLTRVRHVSAIAVLLTLVFAAALALLGALLLRAARAAHRDPAAQWVCALISLALVALGAADLNRPRGALGLAAAILLTVLGLVGSVGACAVLLSRDPNRED